MQRTLARISWFLAAIAVLLSAIPISGRAATNETGIPVIKFDGVDLITAIENLAGQADINYLIDPRIGWKNPPDPQGKPIPRITISWTNLTAQQALKGVLSYYGMQMVDISGTSISKITLTNLTAKPVDRQWIQRSTNSIIPLVQFSSVPLDTVLESLSRQEELTLIIDKELRPGLSARMVEARWTSVSARQAIAALCENYDLKLESFARAIRISRPDSGEKKPAAPKK
jgi:hypothetical protein